MKHFLIPFLTLAMAAQVHAQKYIQVKIVDNRVIVRDSTGAGRNEYDVPYSKFSVTSSISGPSVILNVDGYVYPLKASELRQWDGTAVASDVYAAKNKLLYGVPGRQLLTANTSFPANTYRRFSFAVTGATVTLTTGSGSAITLPPGYTEELSAASLSQINTFTISGGSVIVSYTSNY